MKAFKKLDLLHPVCCTDILHRMGKNLASTTNKDQSAAQTNRIGLADAISGDTKEASYWTYYLCSAEGGD
jgi:hypothetical protein